MQLYWPRGQQLVQTSTEKYLISVKKWNSVQNVDMEDDQHIKGSLMQNVQKSHKKKNSNNINGKYTSLAIFYLMNSLKWIWIRTYCSWLPKKPVYSYFWRQTCKLYTLRKGKSLLETLSLYSSKWHWKSNPCDAQYGVILYRWFWLVMRKTIC